MIVTLQEYDGQVQRGPKMALTEGSVIAQGIQYAERGVMMPVDLSRSFIVPRTGMYVLVVE